MSPSALVQIQMKSDSVGLALSIKNDSAKQPRKLARFPASFAVGQPSLRHLSIIVSSVSLCTRATYLKYRLTNAASESINAKIQWVKYTARGFRNKKNFQTAILFK